MSFMLQIFGFLSMLAISASSVSVDPSNFASVFFEGDKWRIEETLNDFNNQPKLVARANFTNSQLIDGWTHLQIETRPDATDQHQAIAAGIAEGFLTRKMIVEHYNEFYAYDLCVNDPEACEWVKSKFAENTDYVMSQIDLHAFTDPYWHQVSLLYDQMKGMKIGMEMREDKGQDDDKFDKDMGILLLNLPVDFWDYKELYSLQHPKNSTNNTMNGNEKSIEKRSTPSCSVLIKHLKDQQDLVVAHDTWHDYRAMAYRVLKMYTFNYHLLPSSETKVASTSISMSSYAGVVGSMDDFYLLSSGLATTETTLYIWNKQLYTRLKSRGVVMELFRVMVANRLASSGQEWSDLFSKGNSGTYNNQWMIIDYNKFKMNKINLMDGVFFVLEQLPDSIMVADQTQVLRDEGYWASYNRPFYDEMYEESGAREKVEEFGDFFSHNNTNRALIFKREHNKVKDLASLMQLMRYNDFENDPLGLIEGCEPNKRNPAASIANRLDLALEGTKCVFEEHDFMVIKSAHGALDAKLAWIGSFPNLNFVAVAGPPHNEIMKPFQWSNTQVKQARFKPIDKFDFEPRNVTFTFLTQDNSAGLKKISGLSLATALLGFIRI